MDRRTRRSRRLAWRCLAALVSVTLPAGPPAMAAARAAFGAELASPTVREFADWVVSTGDAHGSGFLIIDKVAARAFVFHPDGRLRGAAPALLGLAKGDESADGIGDRPLAEIRPEQRTTPAGRFVADLGRDLGNDDVLWVDYASALSLHRVVTGRPRERRLQRLETASPLDNRISYGCINVTAAFYEGVVRPAFIGASGIVYILPEVRELSRVFPTYASAGAPSAPDGTTLAATLSHRQAAVGISRLRRELISQRATGS